MKVLIAYQYLSFRGGIEEVILESSNTLKARGHHVEILTFRFKDDDPDKTKHNISVSRLPALNFMYKLFGIPFALPLLLPHHIYRIIQIQKKFDVITIHGHPYLASLIFLIVAKMLKKPVILTQHNTRIESPSKLVNTIYDIVDKTYGRFILEASDIILCGSHETKKYIEGITGKITNKTVVLYNGIDSSKFKPVQDKIALKKKFGIDTGKFTCLTIRRITFKNGIDTLLRTAEHLDPTKYQVVIGGTGADMKKVKQYLKEKKITNVTLLGFVKDEELASYYALADCFILPSRRGEGFPMAVLEAFASGIPVIATDSGGHTEIIKADKTGYIVPVDGAKKIAEYVVKLSKDKTLQKTMSLKTRQFIEKSISWDRYIDTFLEVAEKVYGHTK